MDHTIIYVLCKILDTFKNKYINVHKVKSYVLGFLNLLPKKNLMLYKLNIVLSMRKANNKTCPLLKTSNPFLSFKGVFGIHIIT